MATIKKATNIKSQNRIDKIKDVLFKLPKGGEILFSVGKEVFSIDENHLKFLKFHIKNRGQLLKEVILFSDPVDVNELK